MKQHITAEQLNELSTVAKNNLDNWFARQPYQYTITAVQKIGKTGFKNHTPLLTIGQMIEFIQELSNNKTDYIDNYFDHQIHGNGRTGYDTDLSIGWSGTIELCDVLWKMVSQILNK